MKLSKNYSPYAFAFFMAGIMAFLMSMVIVAANTGLNIGYIKRVLHSYALAMPVAFICILFVRPLVIKLTSLVIRDH